MKKSFRIVWEKDKDIWEIFVPKRNNEGEYEVQNNKYSEELRV